MPSPHPSRGELKIWQRESGGGANRGSGFKKNSSRAARANPSGSGTQRNASPTPPHPPAPGLALPSASLLPARAGGALRRESWAGGFLPPRRPHLPSAPAAEPAPTGQPGAPPPLSPRAGEPRGSAGARGERGPAGRPARAGGS